ncbi:hypothetical protein JCM8097_003787 [Rhodosporidiobolus ruineniae]
MHAFFTPSFEPLQAMLVDCLAEEGVHAVLPLLGVNRLLRSLAVSRMLKEYKKTKLVKWDEQGEEDKIEEMIFIPVLSEGEYVQVTYAGRNPDGPTEQDDPRTYLVEAADRTARNHSVPLLFTSFDPVTMLCSFKPPHNAMVCYTLSCNEKHDVRPDVCHSFEFTPSAWFRDAAADSKTAHLGLELAARPDRFPPCYEYSFFPNAPKNPGPFTEEAYEAGYDGFEMLDAEGTLVYQRDWKVSYQTCRLDFDADERGSQAWIPASLTVEELKVPFIDLFAPRLTLNKRGFYDNSWWSTM